MPVPGRKKLQSRRATIREQDEWFDFSRGTSFRMGLSENRQGCASCTSIPRSCTPKTCLLRGEIDQEESLTAREAMQDQKLSGELWHVGGRGRLNIGEKRQKTGAEICCSQQGKENQCCETGSSQGSRGKVYVGESEDEEDAHQQNHHNPLVNWATHAAKYITRCDGDQLSSAAQAVRRINRVDWPRGISRIEGISDGPAKTSENSQGSI